MTFEQDVAALQKIVDESRAIVFFGGAGVSTESGIPDFRSVDGLYNQKYAFPPETILSHDFFMENPEEFYRFHKDKILIEGATPNPAHLALARLEAAGKLLGVITQNIDGLHQAAGSKNVVELHGTTLRNRCMACGKNYDADYVRRAPGVPRCSCGGLVKPEVTLYGEALPDGAMEQAVAWVRRADTLIVGGTSLAVYPAAGLVDYFRGKNLVVLNMSPTRLDTEADLCIARPIGKVLGSLRI